MAWSKIKTIIILILLGTNLCLIGFTVNRVAQARQLEAQARADAIAFLQGKGIQLQEEQVPKTMTLNPMRVSRDIERECVLAAALLKGEVAVQARGAEVYRYYNQNGSVQFHSNGEFFARFAAGTMKAEDVTLEEHAQQTLERLDIQGTVTESVEEDGVWVLKFQEEWDGVPLLNCQATLNYENGALVSITGGRRLIGEPEENTSSSPITVATALMKFYYGVEALGDACTQISSITQGYMVTATISDPMPMVPVWYIVTDVRSYQLDTLTGELSCVA